MPPDAYNKGVGEGGSSVTAKLGYAVFTAQRVARVVNCERFKSCKKLNGTSRLKQCRNQLVIVDPRNLCTCTSLYWKKVFMMHSVLLQQEPSVITMSVNHSLSYTGIVTNMSIEVFQKDRGFVSFNPVVLKVGGIAPFGSNKTKGRKCSAATTNRSMS